MTSTFSRFSGISGSILNFRKASTMACAESTRFLMTRPKRGTGERDYSGIQRQGPYIQRNIFFCQPPTFSLSLSNQRLHHGRSQVGASLARPLHACPYDIINGCNEERKRWPLRLNLS
ncbi:hypothetical protein NDA10_007580 [Ustilago hordei]|nr:hypothetical protein NDA10_007580 [Ustilago hordei]